jgi:hypothetical protein
MTIPSKNSEYLPHVQYPNSLTRRTTGEVPGSTAIDIQISRKELKNKQIQCMMLSSIGCVFDSESRPLRITVSGCFVKKATF